jgi:protein TonB
MPDKSFFFFALFFSFTVANAQSEAVEQEYLTKFSSSFVDNKISHNATNLFWSFCLGEEKELQNQELSERYGTLLTDSNLKIAFYKRLNYYLSGTINYYTDFLQLKMIDGSSKAGFQTVFNYGQLKDYSLLVAGYGQDPFLQTQWTSHIKSFSSNDQGQQDTVVIYKTVDEYPKFGNGDADLLSFLKRHIIYPQFERDNDIQGNIVVRFIICTDGYLCCGSTIRHVNENLETEAIRVTKMLHLWNPGKLENQFVPVYFNMPISFKLR